MVNEVVDALTRLAILHGTDKFGKHDYTPHYFALLQHLRDRPLRMLEIGVGGYGKPDRGGESLATWRDFFPDAQITGLDIEPKTLHLGPRVKIVQGSQIDADCLQAIVAERGPFDVILDDGSHENDHVIRSFEMLFPTLVPGGIYIVEDVQTAFFPRYGGSLTMDAPNSVAYFADQMLAFLAVGVEDVAAVERFHNIVVIHKADPQTDALTVAADRRVQQAGAVHRLNADDALADGDTLLARIKDANAGDVLLLQGAVSDTTFLRQLYAQIDHREIRANFPKAPIHDVARHVMSVAAYPDGIVVEIGDNDYPSNFSNEPSHPLVAAAIATMNDVIDDPDATAPGLLQFAHLARKYIGLERALELVDRLRDLGSTDARYYHLATMRLQHRADWKGIAELNREGRTHHPLDPQITANLGKALQRLGQLDEGERIMREVLAKTPGAIGVMVALAQILEAQGRIDEALEVQVSTMKRYKMPLYRRRLAEVMTLADKYQRGTFATQMARDLLAIDAGDEAAQAMLRKYAEGQAG